MSAKVGFKWSNVCSRIHGDITFSHLIDSLSYILSPRLIFSAYLWILLPKFMLILVESVYNSSVKILNRDFFVKCNLKSLLNQNGLMKNSVYLYTMRTLTTNYSLTYGVQALHMVMSVHFRPPTYVHQNFQIITPYIVPL